MDGRHKAREEGEKLNYSFQISQTGVERQGKSELDHI